MLYDKAVQQIEASDHARVAMGASADTLKEHLMGVLRCDDGSNWTRNGFWIRDRAENWWKPRKRSSILWPAFTV